MADHRTSDCALFTPFTSFPKKKQLHSINKDCSGQMYNLKGQPVQTRYCTQIFGMVSYISQGSLIARFLSEFPDMHICCSHYKGGSTLFDGFSFRIKLYLLQKTSRNTLLVNLANILVWDIVLLYVHA